MASALRETTITGGSAVITIEHDLADAFAEPVRRLVTVSHAWSAAAELARARGKELRWETEAANLLAAYADLGRADNHS